MNISDISRNVRHISGISLTYQTYPTHISEISQVYLGHISGMYQSLIISHAYIIHNTYIRQAPYLNISSHFLSKTLRYCDIEGVAISCDLVTIKLSSKISSQGIYNTNKVTYVVRHIQAPTCSHTHTLTHINSNSKI